MFNTAKFLLVIIATLFLNFSYGSLYIKPNYGIYKIGDKITITWNSSRKINNATLSYYSIKNSSYRQTILTNITEEKFKYTWEIPEEFNNDVGYFIVWDNGNKFVERSNSITIKNIQEEEVQSNKKYLVAHDDTLVKPDTSLSKRKDEDENQEDETLNNSGSGNVYEHEEKNGDQEDNDDDNDIGQSTSSLSDTTVTNYTDSNTSEMYSANRDINNVSEDTTESGLQSKFNSFMEKCKSNIYLVIGGGVLVVLILAYIIVKLCSGSSRQNKIPTGKRSMKRFTLREEVVPPIAKYNDTWKNTLNKGYSTLPKNNPKKSSLDSETEQLINGDNLISDAEKFARKHGLTDTEWVARKDYIPYREDELEVYEGNRIKVFELYDDLWCYGMNLDHYGTLNNDNEGMFPSSILPVEVITALLNATRNGTDANANANANANTNVATAAAQGQGQGQVPSNANVANGSGTPSQKEDRPAYEVTIDCQPSPANASPASGTSTHTNGSVQVNGHSQFTLPKPLAVPLMPPKPLPVIPNLNRSSSLRSSVHRKRNSNPIDKSPLVINGDGKRGSTSTISSAGKRHSQLSNIFNGGGKRSSQRSSLSNEIDLKMDKAGPHKHKSHSSLQNKLLFISTNGNAKEANSKSEDAKALLSSPESDYPNKSTEESPLNSPVPAAHPIVQPVQSMPMTMPGQPVQPGQPMQQPSMPSVQPKPSVQSVQPMQQQPMPQVSPVPSVQAGQAGQPVQPVPVVGNHTTSPKASASSPSSNTNMNTNTNTTTTTNNNNNNHHHHHHHSHSHSHSKTSQPQDEFYQQQLLIQKQREQLQQQQLQQQKLQEQLKQQQLQQQLQQQQIQMQLKQLQQLQQEKERQIQQQKQQLQQQLQQQQLEQQQLRIQREKQQIIQKSKLKEIEYERERLLQQASMNQQNHRDSILPSYSEAVNNQPYANYASSSSANPMNVNMVDGFPLPPSVGAGFPSPPSGMIHSPVMGSMGASSSSSSHPVATSPIASASASTSSPDADPELYPRNASYKHQVQKRDQAPENYPRNTSRMYVDEHPSIGRKIKQTRNDDPNAKDQYALKQKEEANKNYP